MKSCLIVDDSRVIRKVSRHILETLGFHVEEAENGQEGLDKCAEGMPDVVLLDWNMPVMTGIEFITQLRQRDEHDGEKAHRGRAKRKLGRGALPGGSDAPRRRRDCDTETGVDDILSWRGFRGGFRARV